MTFVGSGTIFYLKFLRPNKGEKYNYFNTSNISDSSDIVGHILNSWSVQAFLLLIKLSQHIIYVFWNPLYCTVSLYIWKIYERFSIIYKDELEEIFNGMFGHMVQSVFTGLGVYFHTQFSFWNYLLVAYAKILNHITIFNNIHQQKIFPLYEHGRLSKSDDVEVLAE